MAGVPSSRAGGSSSIRASTGGSSFNGSSKCSLGGGSTRGFRGGTSCCGLSGGPSGSFGGNFGGGFGSCSVRSSSSFPGGSGFSGISGFSGASEFGSTTNDGFYGYGGRVGGGVGDGGLFSGSEKQTMQNLNDRLANYLDKVRALEEANADLENKIKEWYDKLGLGFRDNESRRDYSKYYAVIEDLRNQIIAATVDNASLTSPIDSARLTAEDFKMKYQNELCLRQLLEADLSGLQKVHNELNVTTSILKIQSESLAEELAHLKKDHEEEMSALQTQSCGDLTVEVKVAPGADLTQLLNSMRQQYEALAQQNRREAEDRFNKQSALLQTQISTNAGAASSATGEITELKRILQTLQVELQSVSAMQCSLEGTLADTEAGYVAQLSGIQTKISSLEELICQVRDETQCQNSESEQLLDIKTHLEKEIETYHHLLDGEGGSGGKGTESKGSFSADSRGRISTTQSLDSNKSRGTRTVTDNRQEISTQVNNVSDIKFK
ncbi:keratin, type I cytoskeletal 24 [Otolemur garnettii]|uniref:keratin, type I cytoskeletal 24 n=1 Tax=Otolemur garnettii TaxID=30611 RepID=UPI000C7F76AF|nr:keratin, type I cytoskeletal 24 [Otolemur garnettii]